MEIIIWIAFVLISVAVGAVYGYAVYQSHRRFKERKAEMDRKFEKRMAALEEQREMATQSPEHARALLRKSWEALGDDYRHMTAKSNEAIGDSWRKVGDTLQEVLDACPPYRRSPTHGPG